MPDWLFRRQEEIERLRQVLADAGKVPRPAKPVLSAVTQPEPAPPAPAYSDGEGGSVSSAGRAITG
jgi:hypothetical protein